MMKKHGGKIILVVAASLLIGSIIYANVASTGSNEGVIVIDHVKGNADAAVVLTEFSDFQCPACGQFYPVVKDIVEQYDDQLRFEYKHFPLVSIHPFAVPAAKAAEAAGQQGKFFEMHDLLFENQTAWSNAANPTAHFVAYAEQLELDTDAFKRHMRAPILEEKIEAEFAEARGYGMTGTPSFMLNGVRLQFGTFEEFTTAIEDAINAASGTEVGTTTPATAPASDIKFGI